MSLCQLVACYGYCGSSLCCGQHSHESKRAVVSIFRRAAHTATKVWRVDKSMNVLHPPDAPAHGPDDLRSRPKRHNPRQTAFSSKYALELPPPVAGSFSTVPRRRAAVAKKQADLRRRALVGVALERQIWLENTEKEEISREIVRIARRLDKKRRAVAAREDKAFRAGAREAALVFQTCWRRHVRSRAWARVKAALLAGRAEARSQAARILVATPLQARLRGRLVRCALARRRVATPLQTLWRAHLARRELKGRRFGNVFIGLQTGCRALFARCELARRRRVERARQAAAGLAVRAVRRWLRWRFLEKVRECVRLLLARHRFLQKCLAECRQVVASTCAGHSIREVLALVAVASACAGHSISEALALAAEREAREEEVRRQMAAAIAAAAIAAAIAAAAATAAAKLLVATLLQTQHRARTARRAYIEMRDRARELKRWGAVCVFISRRRLLTG